MPAVVANGARRSRGLARKESFAARGRGKRAGREIGRRRARERPQVPDIRAGGAGREGLSHF
eukprot:10092805-Lingulodinium_polyedra.AAC.1